MSNLLFTGISSLGVPGSSSAFGEEVADQRVGNATFAHETATIVATKRTHLMRNDETTEETTRVPYFRYIQPTTWLCWSVRSMGVARLRAST